MYNKVNTEIVSEILTKDFILSKVSDYDIFKAYIGNFTIGEIYNSPLRKDKNPSFGIFYSKKYNCLLFKDHGTGEKGDVFRFVKLLTGITNYNQLLNRIKQDLNINNNTKLTKTKIYSKPKETIISVVRQEFTSVDIKYWKQFGISKNTLKLFNVNSIKYYLCNGIVKAIYSLDNPMFCYKVFNKFKIYRPLGNKYIKWRNNLTVHDIQGLQQLPERGNLLIITKSLKDCMVLYEMGYNAIAPSSESTFIPEGILKMILKHFKHVIINFDRDKPGIKQMRRISLETGLNGLLIHKKFKSKDISDAVKNNSFKEIKTWLKQELKRYE